MANLRETYLQNARLADAAYAYLDKNMTDQEVINSLRARNFTQDEAQSFVDKYRIVGTLSEPISGIQAAIFEEKATCKKTMTVAGVNGLSDIKDSAMIGTLGIPILLSQYNALSNFYEETVQGGKLGVNEKITVTGHSLGGFDSIAFTLANPDVVEHAYIYNAPGLGGISLQALKRLGLLPESLPFSKITNIFTADSENIITGWGIAIGNVLRLSGRGHGLNAILEALSKPGDYLADGKLNWWATNSLSQLIAIFLGATKAADFNYSPIILDLDGDGAETIGYQEGAYFDHDGNGFAERTGWAASDDGILVLDRNGDGIINNGRELFGDNTLLKNGQNASNGFAALAEFDDNQDGKIDFADVVWSQLKVWRDHDGDGYSLPGEFYTLDELGIKSLNMQYTDASNPDGKGNTEAWIGAYEKTDGTTLKMSDYLFQRDPAYTIAEEWLPVPEDIAVLPNLRGYGNIYDLHQAIVRDNSGKLKTLTEQFMVLTDAKILQQTEGLQIGSDTSKLTNTRMALLEQILFKWAGCDDINSGSRGYWYDSQKLAVMEKFFGQDFDGLYGPNPAQNASTYLTVAYRRLSEMYYSQIMAQTHLKDLNGQIGYTWDEQNQTLKGDLTAIAGKIQAVIDSDPEAGKLLLGEFARSLRGMQLEGLMSLNEFRQSFGYEDEEIGFIIDSAGKNFISGTAGNDIIFNTMDDDAILGSDGDDKLSAGQGNDVLYGQGGNDNLVGGVENAILYGGDGNDYVQGGIGNDFLHGGSGDDFLRGSKGDDVYIYGEGFGNDTIYSMEAAYYGLPNQNGNDTVLFTGDLTADSFDYLSDAAFRDLILRIKDTGETLRFTDWFWGTERQVEQLRFSNGNVLLTADVGRRGVTLSGTEGNDSIVTRSGDRVMMDGLGGNDYLAGAELNDVLRGGTGNDILSGGAGNDILDGGAGNDTLYGWAGDDTFIYGRGYENDLVYDNASAGSGYDTVEFTEGLTADSFELLSDSSSTNLILRIKDTGETLTLDKWFYGSNYQIESLKFSDESVLTPSEISNRGVTIIGTDKNENLFGRNGYRFSLYGLTGNDSLNGADREDQLYGGTGNDTLSGAAGSDILQGELGNDILFGGYGGDSYIFERHHGQDRIEDYDTVAGNIDTVKLGEGIDKQGIVMFRDGLDLLIFTDDDDYIRVSRQFQANYGIERLEVTDGCYVTRQDMENIVNAMIDFNNTQGMDIVQKYNTLRNDQIYQAVLAQTWHQQLNPQG